MRSPPSSLQKTQGGSSFQWRAEATKAPALNREVTVTPTTPIVAEVTLQDGRSLSHELLNADACWWYRKYAANDEELKRLETEAHTQRLGVWATESPLSPWEWRARRAERNKMKPSQAYSSQSRFFRLKVLITQQSPNKKRLSRHSARRNPLVSRLFQQVGFTRSIRMIGPIICKDLSNCTKLGTSSSRIQQS